MPQFAPPIFAPEPPKGLLGRIGSAVKTGLANAGSNLFAPPAGLEQLTSPEDASHARRNALLQMGIAMSQGTGETPLASLGRGLGAAQSAFHGSLQDAVQQRVQAEQIAKQRAMVKARADIANKYPARPGETAEQTVDRMKQMFAEYTRIGDLETAGKLGEVIKSIGQPTSKKPTWEDFGGYKVQYDADGKPVQRVDKTPTPRDPALQQAAEEARATRQDNANFRNEDKLATSFNRDTEKYRELHMKLNGAVSEAARALAGDGAAQTNVLYSFVSAMDPQSAVREGEMALVQAAASLRARADRMYRQAVESGKSAAVPRQMLEQMRDLMARRIKMNQEYVQGRANYYSARARRSKIDPEGLFPVLEDAPAVAAPAKKPTGKLGSY